MLAIIYPYGCNLHGYYIQTEKISKVIEKITKKELMQMADLRHPVLSKNEFYNVLSTDAKGNKKNEFTLMANGFLIKVIV